MTWILSTSHFHLFFFNELFTNLPSQKLHSNVDLTDFSGSKLNFDFSYDFSLVMYLDKKAWKLESHFLINSIFQIQAQFRFFWWFFFFRIKNGIWRNFLQFGLELSSWLSYFSRSKNMILISIFLVITFWRIQKS